MSKILVIGGRGFIGKPLVAELEKKHEIVMFEGDILNKQELSRNFGCNPDIVVHLASPNTLKVFQEQPEYVADAIIQGTKNIAILCKQHKAKLVYASSIGATQVNPNYSVRSCYDVSKLMAETYIQMMLEDFLILRIPAVYGDNMKKDRLLAKILDGSFEMHAEAANNIISYMMLPEFIEETVRVFNAKGVYTYNAEHTTLNDFYEQHKPK